MLPRTIAILATLDTKGAEVAYIRDEVAGSRPPRACHRHRADRRATVAHDISNRDVAAAGGGSLDALRRHADREESGPVMAAGATKIIRELVAREEIHAFIALGGTQGTTLCTGVMRALPYGFPKIMVSTMASGNVAPWVGTSDITMMYSVTDIMGLNPFMRRILANAAGAACGMAEVELPSRAGQAAGRDHHRRHHHQGRDDGRRRCWRTPATRRSSSTRSAPAGARWKR